VRQGTLCCASFRSLEATLLAFAAPAVAQSFPAKPLRLIVRAPPGGGDDLHARLLAGPLGKVLNQQVLVEYRPGAGGLVAWEFTAKAPPDGYTLLLAASGLAGIRSLRPDMPVDPWKDFAWVSKVGTFPLVFYVNNALPARNLKELIALARKRPGELNYGSSGVGATPHLAAEYFRGAAKIDINHVPFKGSSQLYIDVMAGRIEMGTSVLGGTLSFVRAGKLRALAVTAASRSPQLPEFTPFYAIVTQGQTPRDIVNQLSVAIGKVMNVPEFRDGLLQAGTEPGANTPDQMLALAKHAAGQIDRIVRTAGIKGGD
jgi:tripartite-type tricarboxylate transporter receptor subunit TctC